MTVDTGSSINVIDENTFNRLGDPRLQKTNIRAYNYGNKDPVSREI